MGRWKPLFQLFFAIIIKNKNLMQPRLAYPKVTTEENLLNASLFVCKTRFLLIFHNLFSHFNFFFSSSTLKNGHEDENHKSKRLKSVYSYGFCFSVIRRDCRKGLKRELMNSRAVLFRRFDFSSSSSSSSTKTPLCIISSHKTYK